jgi:hypothetical protein
MLAGLWILNKGSFELSAAELSALVTIEGLFAEGVEPYMFTELLGNSVLELRTIS